MIEHPDPVTARLLAADSVSRAEYERVLPRYLFIGAVVQARHARGWSQRDLATTIGTTQSAIARLESGRQDPRLSTIVAICRALNLPLIVGAAIESSTDSTQS